MLPETCDSPLSLPQLAKFTDTTKALQSRLVEFGYLNVADGKLGPITAAALHRFQRDRNIQGEEEALGNKTLKALHDKTTIPAKVLAIECVKSTVLKRQPIDSNSLPIKDKFSITAGQRLPIAGWTQERNHYKITLRTPVQGFYDWYAFCPHTQIVEGGQVVESATTSSSIRLSVPYLSQRDNFYNPSGSCNVTSIAMCLQHLGVERRDTRYRQFEDELYRYCLDKGYSRHSPHDLARVVRDYGRKDEFTDWGTIERCQNHLRGGNPCVIHGYFTSFGHIIVLVGFDEKGFIVHDPYGEWYPSGYDTRVSGANLHYSYNLIRNTCIPDGQFWVHYISR